MTARYVADEAALREVLAHALWDAQGPEAVDYTHTEHLANAQLAALLTSGVVQPREDAVREAQSGAWRVMHAAVREGLTVNPVALSDALIEGGGTHEDARAALTLTTPGTDRPAAEDGPA